MNIKILSNQFGEIRLGQHIEFREKAGLAERGYSRQISPRRAGTCQKQDRNRQAALGDELAPGKYAVTFHGESVRKKVVRERLASRYSNFPVVVLVFKMKVKL